jgi:hypothetical protein
MVVDRSFIFRFLIDSRFQRGVFCNFLRNLNQIAHRDAFRHER